MCECGIMKWSGKTSTFGTQKVFDLRIECHQVFDAWWQQIGYSRAGGYRELAKLMGMPKKECHIGMFQETECRQLLKLLGEK